MTSDSLMQLLISQTGVTRDNTCDGIITGNGKKEIKKIGVCFKASAEVIMNAVNEKCDMLLCHEPLYYGDESGNADDAVYREKKKLISDSALTVCRYHDYAHEMSPDYIHAGFLRALALELDENKSYKRESLGIRRYALKEKISIKALVDRIKNRLNISYLRFAGNENTDVKVLCLGLGWVGATEFALLNRSDADVFITGEAGEVYAMEYIRDSAFFGNKVAVLALGHYGSEHEGMRLLAEEISKKYIEAVYYDSGEPFKVI